MSNHPLSFPSQGPFHVAAELRGYCITLTMRSRGTRDPTVFRAHRWGRASRAGVAKRMFFFSLMAHIIPNLSRRPQKAVVRIFRIQLGVAAAGLTNERRLPSLARVESPFCQHSAFSSQCRVRQHWPLNADANQGALSLTPRNGTEWGHAYDGQLARPIGDNRPYHHLTVNLTR